MTTELTSQQEDFVLERDFRKFCNKLLCELTKKEEDFLLERAREEGI